MTGSNIGAKPANPNAAQAPYPIIATQAPPGSIDAMAIAASARASSACTDSSARADPEASSRPRPRAIPVSERTDPAADGRRHTECGRFQLRLHGQDSIRLAIAVRQGNPQGDAP